MLGVYNGICVLEHYENIRLDEMRQEESYKAELKKERGIQISRSFGLLVVCVFFFE